MSNLDKYFRDNLQKHEATPPAALWNRLEDHLDEKDKRKGFIWWQQAAGIAAAGTLLVGIWFVVGRQENNTALMVLATNSAKDTLSVNSPNRPVQDINTAASPNNEAGKAQKTEPIRKPLKQRARPMLTPQVPEHLAESEKNQQPDNEVIRSKNMALINSAKLVSSPDTAPSIMLAEADVKMPSVAQLQVETVEVELRPQKQSITEENTASTTPRPKTKFGRFIQKVRKIRSGEEELNIGEKLTQQRDKFVAIIKK